jgi:hypothetical protein
MEKRTLRWGALRLLLAFFAGVLTTVYLLVPGHKGPTVLVYGDSRTQLADIGNTGERLTAMGRQALDYAAHAKASLGEKAKDKP